MTLIIQNIANGDFLLLAITLQLWAHGLHKLSTTHRLVSRVAHEVRVMWRYFFLYFQNTKKNMDNSITFQKDIKRFYVSGKISGMKIEYAKQNFHFACLEVQKFHEADFVVNPFDIQPFLGIKNGYFI